MVAPAPAHRLALRPNAAAVASLLAAAASQFAPPRLPVPAPQAQSSAAPEIIVTIRKGIVNLEERIARAIPAITWSTVAKQLRNCPVGDSRSGNIWENYLPTGRGSLQQRHGERPKHIYLAAFFDRM